MLPHVRNQIQMPAFRPRSTLAVRDPKVCDMAHQIIYAAPDVTHPSGGMRVFYRHVELLTRAGYHAAIWHSSNDVSLDWFATDAPTVNGLTLDLDETDMLVIPEGSVLANDDPAPGCRKIIFNQNHYFTFNSADVLNYPQWSPPPGVWVVSHVSYRIVSRLRQSLGFCIIERIPCAIDTRLFRPAARRHRKVVWMPRKRPYEAELINALLLADNRIKDVTFVPLDGLNEEETARELGGASVFVALGRDEGFGLPVAEALAAGCAVVGYPAGGGAELFDGPGTYAVQDSDILALVECVVALLRDPPSHEERLTYRAWIEQSYSESNLVKCLTSAIDRAFHQPASAGSATHPWPKYMRLHGQL